MAEVLVGVDVGSSSCKVMFIDAAGTVLATHSEPYLTHYPQIGWAEQHPEDWYQAACQTLRAGLDGSAIAPSDIRGIAIDGPAHNVALMNEQGDVLAPTIHWSDLRSTLQCQRLEAELGDRIFEITNCRVHPSWTLAQLVWLKENQPTIWHDLRRILVTKDYVRYRFTGHYATDVYDAIGTQLYDAQRGEWSTELCDLIGFDVDWLPPVVPATDIAGYLLPEVARATGLPAGIPVAVGSGDSVVEALGVGAICPGQGIIKLGTAANVNLVTARPLPSPLSLTYRHVVDPYWFTITATNSGTATLRWFRDTFCRLEAQQAANDKLDVYTLISQMAADAPVGSEGIIFHPYLMGERTPYWDPTLRGNFFGLRAGHNIQHFARAILEGVAYSIRDCLDAVRALGAPTQQFTLIGGGAKSRLWQQILCDVLGRPLIRPRIEGAAFGSALVAAIAVGTLNDWETALATFNPVGATLHPDPTAQAQYEKYFGVYRALVKDLQVHSTMLTQLIETDGVDKV